MAGRPHLSDEKRETSIKQIQNSKCKVQSYSSRFKIILRPSEAREEVSFLVILYLIQNLVLDGVYPKRSERLEQ